MRKKFLVLFLVFGLVFSGVSKAFIFLGAPAVGLMSAGEIASALTGLGIGALIGQQMGWIELPSLNPATDDNVRIPLTDLPRDRPSRDTTNIPSSTPVVNPDSVVPIRVCPADYTSSPSQSYSCIYTTTYTYTKVDEYSCSTHFTKTEVSGCADYPWVLNSGDSGLVSTVANGCPSGYTINGSSCSKDTSTPSCNVGYTVVNGACALTNPQAIPDGKADIEAFSPSPGVVSYRPIDGDPDQNAGLTISQGAALFNLMHPNYGNDPATTQPVEVAIDPMGGTTSMCPYQTCIPIPGLPGHFRISALSNTVSHGQAVVIDVNKATGVVDQAAVVPLAGYVLNQGQSYTDTNGVTQTVGAGQIAIVQPINGTYVQSANPAVPTVQIDTSNLAKTGEAANAANTVVQALNTNLQDAALDNVAPMTSINASFDALNDNLTPKPENQPDINFSWVPSLLPGSFTACTAFTFDMNPTIGLAAGMTGSGSIDICDKLDLARQILGWMLGALTAFLIFRIFVNSNKGAL